MDIIYDEVLKLFPNYVEKVKSSNDKKAFNTLVGEIIKKVGKNANIKNIITATDLNDGAIKAVACAKGN